MGYLFPKIPLKKWMTKTGEWLTHIDVENSQTVIKMVVEIICHVNLVSNMYDVASASMIKITVVSLKCT